MSACATRGNGPSRALKRTGPVLNAIPEPNRRRSKEPPAGPVDQNALQLERASRQYLYEDTGTGCRRAPLLVFQPVARTGPTGRWRAPMLISARAFNIRVEPAAGSANGPHIEGSRPYFCATAGGMVAR